MESAEVASSNWLAGNHTPSLMRQRLQGTGLQERYRSILQQDGDDELLRSIARTFAERLERSLELQSSNFVKSSKRSR